ncbi:MAG: hypothetical protein HON94_01015 [Methylococcales bacterium]|jgi:hypothetical protein|nr:hypothetical protein [Methylococcales bacterium]MBT7410755.1 hypothetical protein [Methylococcales bacterium]
MTIQTDIKQEIQERTKINVVEIRTCIQHNQTSIDRLLLVMTDGETEESDKVRCGKTITNLKQRNIELKATIHDCKLVKIAA